MGVCSCSCCRSWFRTLRGPWIKNFWSFPKSYMTRPWLGYRWRVGSSEWLVAGTWTVGAWLAWLTPSCRWSCWVGKARFGDWRLTFAAGAGRDLTYCWEGCWWTSDDSTQWSVLPWSGCLPRWYLSAMTFCVLSNLDFSIVFYYIALYLSNISNFLLFYLFICLSFYLFIFWYV